MIEITEIDLGEENPRRAVWNNWTLILFAKYTGMPAAEMFGKIGSGGLSLYDYAVFLSAAVHNADAKISVEAAMNIIGESDVNVAGLALETSKRLLADLMEKNPIPQGVVTKLPASTLPKGGKKKNKKKSPGTVSKETPSESG